MTFLFDTNMMKAKSKIPVYLDKVLEQHVFQLVVDVNLPDMNGMAIGEVARKQYRDQIAIVVITGQNIQKRRMSSLQLGADDFLGKPFAVNELIAHIEGKLRRVSTG